VQRLEQVVAGEPHGHAGCFRSEARRLWSISRNRSAEIPCLPMHEVRYRPVLADGAAQVRLSFATEEIEGRAHCHRCVEHGGSGCALSNGGPDRIVRGWCGFIRREERGKCSHQPAVGFILNQWKRSVQGVLNSAKHQNAWRWWGRCPCQHVHDDYSAKQIKARPDDAGIIGRQPGHARADIGVQRQPRLLTGVGGLPCNGRSRLGGCAASA
jgi:hypothetical protein